MGAESIVLLLSAAALGVLHAFEADHLAAVSAFVAQRPEPRQAMRFGLKWSIGHGISLLVLGTILYLFKVAVTLSVSGWLERSVGLALAGLGAWTLVRLRPGALHHTHSHHHKPGESLATESAHDHRHAHTHADGTVHSHKQGQGSLWMGVLHGAAGTAAFVGGTFVALAKSYVMVLAYTVSFSLGVLAAMGLYAGALGGVLCWGSRKSHRALTGARAAFGAWALVVGMYWLLK